MTCRNCLYAGENGYMCWLHDIDVTPKNSCKDFKHKKYEDDEY